MQCIVLILLALLQLLHHLSSSFTERISLLLIMHFKWLVYVTQGFVVLVKFGSVLVFSLYLADTERSWSNKSYYITHIVSVIEKVVKQIHCGKDASLWLAGQLPTG